jgi:hypothetical protein
MSEYRLLMISLVLALSCSCGPTGQPNAATPDVPVRQVILFNEDGKKTVGLMKDTEGLRVFYNMLKTPSKETMAQFKAAEVEGKIFQVDSGTKAVVLKEVPINGVSGMSMMRIRISNGPRESEEALCFSTDTQPDNSR